MVGNKKGKMQQSKGERMDEKNERKGGIGREKESEKETNKDRK
jgi:hypothetical protein